MGNSVKLVISDIDGTLLNAKHNITGELKKAVKRVSANNIPVVLASARAPQGMYPIAKKLAIQSNPLVSYNGAYILKMHEQNELQSLKSHPMKKEAVIRIVETVKKKFTEISINIYAKNNWFVEKDDIWIKIESSITKLMPTKVHFDSLSKDETIEVHKLLLIGEKDEIQELVAYLKILQLEGVTFYLSKENYLEIVAANVSKETAVKELAGYYRISTKEILTIGDQFNDIPMLKLAGVGVAMGNAPEEVKKAATFVTTSNNNDGAAKALIDHVL
ncbi:hypothetical protein FC19_GL002058 [Liquorilactobacillus aquaticus DSM 21051]|uniref:HAD superfamily hydrolase n=1 Tax=Liquorilactobacillus aquaticus DSM 21051 TaxID=1423725 RepID=A0A0R2CU39_9LACO|nr:Cof-type HAD-IIB family hydrolase [Liquorilactobacillus aquaticus]KRM95294.1 hypothetical protein FC19_GL002058 [Liquorilactobacillus aquaticus DSM 21051]